MKAALLLILLLAPAFAFSHVYPDSNSYCNLVPYYDYALCSKGLKDENDSIVLAPRYSEIRLLPNNLILVKENEQYGVIDCNFETVIPIKYEKLHWMQKYRYQVRCEENYYWLFTTKEGTGLMNNLLEIVLPPIYDQIERVGLEEQIPPSHYYTQGYNITTETASFFKVTLKGKSSIYNESGKEIVPDTFKKITCSGVEKPSSTPMLPKGIFFLAKGDSTQVIFSDQGEQLFEESINAELFVYSLDSSTIVRTFGRDESTMATCLESGGTTEWSKCFISKSHFLLFQSFFDQSFTVYGPRLRALYTGENLTQNPEFLSIKDDHFLKVTHDDKQTVLFSRKGEILLQTKDQLFTTDDQNSGCIWTIPQELDSEDTLRLYFPNGEFKQEYCVNEVQSPQTFKNSRWEDRFEELDPLLFVKQGKKWGALNRAGELNVPFRYDDFGVPVLSADGSRRRPEEGNIIAYYVSKSGKMGALDRNGEKLYPCKYDTLFNAKVDFSYYEFYASHSYPEYFEVNDKNFCHFAIRKNSLVSFINKKERLCDSTFLHFDGHLLLVGNVLIDVNGNVIRKIDRGTIHKTKKYFFHIQSNEAQVILFSGKLGLKIEQFKSAQVEDNYLKIKLTNETMGVISLDGMRWLYAPKYYDISFTKFPPDHAWVKEDTLQTISQYSIKRLVSYDGRWILVDTSYKQLTPFPFRFPVNLIHYPHATFESENKIGMIDSSLNVVFPPNYQLIRPLIYSEYSVLYKDGLWYLGHSSSGSILDRAFNSISDKEVNGTMAVFSFSENDTLIGFVKYNNGFEWAVPMTEMNTLVAEGSLQKSINHDARYTNAGLRDSIDRWRIKNNELIIHFALHRQFIMPQTEMRGLGFIADFEYNQQQYHEPGKQFFEEVNIRAFDAQIESKFTHPAELKELRKMRDYPKCLYQYFYNGEILTVLESDNCSYSSSARRFKNYIYLDSIREIELNDILIKNDKTSAFLQNFVVRWYTEIQSGVEVCPDLDKTEKLMWSEFQFSNEGIAFLDFKFVLSYDEIQPYLTDLGKRLKPWEYLIDEDY